MLACNDIQGTILEYEYFRKRKLLDKCYHGMLKTLIRDPVKVDFFLFNKISEHMSMSERKILMNFRSVLDSSNHK